MGSDMTYIWANEGWLYLAVVIDLFSRCVIGWVASDRMKKDPAIRALDMAMRLRTPSPGCIFHFDRGSQDCSHDFRQKLTEYKMTRPCPARQQAIIAIFQYIHGFYNARRRL